MTDEILEKIRNFLNKHHVISEECHAVYLMVEIRKLLDHKREGRSDKFTLLRFYADWSVHTAKDKITPAIEEIMRQIDKCIPLKKERQHLSVHSKEIAEHTDFIYMNQLRAEMGDFLAEFELPPALTKNEESWISFVKQLTAVLIDQPIRNIESIRTFTFKPAADDAVIWEIDFNDERGTCKFGNVY